MTSTMTSPSTALRRRSPSVPDLQRYISLASGGGEDSSASNDLANLVGLSSNINAGLTGLGLGPRPVNFMMSPSTYMTVSLENKNIKPRIDSFSLEQALYFEPYQESTIKIELLQALRSSNLDLLRSFVVAPPTPIQRNEEENNNNNKRMSSQQENEINYESSQDSQDDEDDDISIIDDDGEKSCSPFRLPATTTEEENNNENKNENDTTVMQQQELQACNQFGENLLHLACRMGISRDVLEFLYDNSANGGANVPLNVRDRFGRTPLHNACMSSNPQFTNIDFIISKSPRMLLFEDDNGKIPFELIPQRCFERWIRFLSEQNILQRVVSAELIDKSFI